MSAPWTKHWCSSYERECFQRLTVNKLNETQFLSGGFQHLGGFTTGSMTLSSHHAAAGRKKTGGPRKVGRMDLFFFDLFIYFHCARSVKHDSYSCWTISRTLLGDVNVVSHNPTAYNTHTFTHTHYLTASFTLEWGGETNCAQPLRTARARTFPPPV